MADMAEHLALGLVGEEQALRYLISKGWRVLDRNWRPDGGERGLELDIVALHADCLVFVEVKTRNVSGDDPEWNRDAGQTGRQRPDHGGHTRACPLRVPVHTALTAAKQRKLARVACYYLTARELWNSPCRFDLICVEQFPNGQSLLEHYSNVIDLRQVVGSGNATWQPW